MKVIYIMGVGHSGSTVFSRYLSQIEGACAIGESKGYFEQSYDKRWDVTKYCSCGEKYDDCEVWGHKPENVKDLQGILADKGFTVMIDSSKEPTYAYGDYIIHLHRPVLVSIWKRLWHKCLRYRGKRREVFWRTKRILQQFKRIKEVKQNREVMSVSYKEFIKDPDETLGRIANWVGERIDSQESHHIAHSNRSKFQKPLRIWSS